MTQAQRTELKRLLCELAPAELHHGCAVGADAECHELALVLGVEKIVVHPSNLADQTAEIQRDGGRSTVTVLEPRNPLTRNRDIVRSVDVLIAAPVTAEQVERSGTWSTVRFARRAMPSVRVIVIPPNGRAREERR